MRFFVDNCISPYLTDALHALSIPDGHQVTHLRSKFDPSTPDDVWINALAEEKDWIIVSGDTRIFRTRLLKKIWMDAKLTSFFLAKGWVNRSLWEISWMLVRWWPEIVEQSKRFHGGGLVIPNASTGKFNPIP